MTLGQSFYIGTVHLKMTKWWWGGLFLNLNILFLLKVAFRQALYGAGAGTGWRDGEKADLARRLGA